MSSIRLMRSGVPTRIPARRITSTVSVAAVSAVTDMSLSVDVAVDSQNGFQLRSLNAAPASGLSGSRVLKAQVDAAQPLIISVKTEADAQAVETCVALLSGQQQTQELASLGVAKLVTLYCAARSILQAPPCMQASLDTISLLVGEGRTEVGDVVMMCRSLLDLPGCGAEEKAALASVCKKALVQHFGSAPAIQSSHALHTQLLNLPIAALKVLLGSDELATDCEDSVVAMACAYEEANHVPIADRRELASLLRLSQCSDDFFVFSLTKRTLFQHLTPQDWVELSAFKLGAHEAVVAKVQAAGHPQAWLTSAKRPAADCLN